MQKLTDGQDTEVVSSLAWLESRWVAAPQAGPAPDGAVAGGPLAGELALGPRGAGDDPVHPATALVSAMTMQASASPGRPLVRGHADRGMLTRSSSQSRPAEASG